MTYDEFLNKYIEHIEGKVEFDERLRPVTAEGNESKEDIKGTIQSKANEGLVNQGSNQLIEEGDYPEGKNLGEIDTGDQAEQR